MDDGDLISFDDDVDILGITPPPSASTENINGDISALYAAAVAEKTDDDTLSVTSQSSGTATPLSIRQSYTSVKMEQVTATLQNMTIKETSYTRTSVAQCPKSTYHPQRKSAVIIAKKKEPAIRDGKEQVRLLTNFYTLQVRNKIVYRYDINVTLMRPAGQNNLNLAKSARDDNARTESHQICMEALRKALETFRMMREGHAVVYDGASIMFSSDSLEMALKPHANALTISVDMLPPEIRKKLARFPDVTDVCLEFQPCKEYASQFDIAEFKNAHSERDMAHLDRTWKQFFEMLTNQNAISSGKYFCFGAGKLFPISGRREEARGGQERVLGANKGIKFIQAAPNSSSIVPALILDAKVGQFFKSQNLVATVCEFMKWPMDPNQRFPLFQDRERPGKMNKEWKAVNDYIKGLRLVLSHSKGETSFIASGISMVSLEEAEEKNFKGQTIRTTDRFPQLDRRYHRFHWPAVLVRSRENGRVVDKMYPMDLLQVAPCQRVPKNKQVDDPPRAGPPQKRFSDINYLMQQLDLDSGGSRNYFLNAFGVSLSERPIEVMGIRRERPKIILGGQRGERIVTTHSETASWRMDHGDQYLGPGKSDMLFIAYTCERDVAQQIQQALERMCQQRGMNLGRVRSHQYSERADTRENLNHLFHNIVQCQKNGEFPENIIVLYVDRMANKSHGLLKLYERQFLILTQHITTEVARKLIRQQNTCSNIVNKLNCKLHGLNHGVQPDGFTQSAWITNNKTLILGYDVAHPPPQLRSEILDKKPPLSPSVVGFSHNGGPHSEQFVGDFHYQTPRKEEVGDHVLISRIKWILEMFQKNRQTLPAQIFIYRDGISEGQYQYAIEHELEAIKQGVEEYCNMVGVKYKPRYVMLVVTKRHNTRFVREGYKGIENSLPGTVIDTQIVRPDCTEFYLQGHRVLQGTGKTPSYVVLVDELGLSSDELQSFTLSLCFSHQIFEGGISLPEPVYQADEWAKRGNDILHAYEEIYELPRCDSNGDYSTPPVDFEMMTKKLAYWNTRLQNSRINA